MKIRYQVAPEFQSLESWIRELPYFFPANGSTFFKNRNEIKVFEVDGMKLNVKEFKVPNLVNRFIYVYLRGSKAARSFSYARKFRGLGVSTPQAVGYAECVEKGLLTRSYFVSLHHDYDYTLREVLTFPAERKDEIFRQWVRFTYEKLHRNGIFHLDYSQGNTLIKEANGSYSFNIVDLNRMRFGPISFKKGLTNFCQLGIDEHILRVVAHEYARICQQDGEKAFDYLVSFYQKSDASKKRWEETKKFWRRIFRSGRAVK